MAEGSKVDKAVSQDQADDSAGSVEDIPMSPGLEAAAAKRFLILRIPLVDAQLDVPREMIPFYAGLAATVVLDLVDWPIALLMAVGHYLAAQGRTEALREFAAGAELGDCASWRRRRQDDRLHASGRASRRDHLVGLQGNFG